jgi:hypothetical protein
MVTRERFTGRARSRGREGDALEKTGGRRAREKKVAARRKQCAQRASCTMGSGSAAALEEGR